MPSKALLTTNLPLPNRRSGKVRDIYDVVLADGSAGVLIVATDRISAFDVIMANGLPGKGIVLTQLSRFWFEMFASSVRHHLISTNADDVPGLTDSDRRLIHRRMMLCRKTQVVPIECVARGYLAGSGFKEYIVKGSVCDEPLPRGLRNGDRLPRPLFTPTTKAQAGHDEPISFAAAAAIHGVDLLTKLRDLTLSLYEQAREYAANRGIILADTKLEFGLPLPETRAARDANEPLLIDEIFTPDSSRFWPVAGWQPGQEQPSFDKQFTRDYLESLATQGLWNKAPPGPVLPDEIVEQTMDRYREAYERLTGSAIRLD